MNASLAQSGPLSDPSIALWRCVSCGGGMNLEDQTPVCESCGRRYRLESGVVVVNEKLSGNNQIVRDFYNGPLWPKFRFWEWFTFLSNGGERRSRDKVLRHLPREPNLNLLDVAIGDGVYLPWLPSDWSVVGIDISTVQLDACRKKAENRPLTLALGEAESLPFRDGHFDSVLSIGGFNYFNDPEGSLREMVRVTRSGGTIVISDEIPDLTNYMLGHWLNIEPLKRVERWMVSRGMNLGDAFTDIVETHRTLDVAEIGRRVLPDCQYQRIWRGVGYVLVGRVP